MRDEEFPRLLDTCGSKTIRHVETRCVMRATHLGVVAGCMYVEWGTCGSSKVGHHGGGSQSDFTRSCVVFLNDVGIAVAQP